MARLGVRERELIRRSAGALGARQELALVVAADRRQVQRREQVGGRGGLERPGQDVAEVPDRVDPLAADVLQHGGERPAIAVDVRDQRDPHASR
jgi:hypothetical protein